jgi:arsenate reductase
MSRKKSVLFICTHNSARSQMAEAYLRAMAGDRYQAESAGFEPRPLNSLVVQAMAEDGLDISKQISKSVFDLYKAGRMFDYVVTVCDDSLPGQCPVFPGVTKRLHLPFADPSDLSGDYMQNLAMVEQVRDAVKTEVSRLVREWDGQALARRERGSPGPSLP